MLRRPFLSLLPHPTTACPAVQAITVQAAFGADGRLALAYSLQGDLDRLAIPAARPPAPVEGLWQHTCFEAFIGAAGSRAYREFNFSPSGQWAAFAFSGYRQREEAVLPALAVPGIVVRRLPGRLELDAILDRALLPALAAGEPVEIGLSAVIEAADGCRSYWALAHPAAQPDFHHRLAFTLTLPTTPTRS